MGPITFLKYSGNGNDFIIMDEIKISPEAVMRLCDRHFGIGADGILLHATSSMGDAKMRIFNADGKEAEMCGNGVRCFAAYLDQRAANKKDEYLIETMNALYPVFKKDGSFAICMSEISDRNVYDLSSFKAYQRAFFINTGVPHLVFLTNDVDKVDIKIEAPVYRHHPMFPKGTNVNFVQVLDLKTKKVKVRTFERGVEDETFSCGTGLTATALALEEWFGWKEEISLTTKGGSQKVIVGPEIYYSGEVMFCFKGEVEV